MVLTTHSYATVLVALNKIDALDAAARSEKAVALAAAAGAEPWLVSGVSGEGVTALLRAAYAEVRRGGEAPAKPATDGDAWRP